MVVTHDRWFLDEISTATWEVNDGEVEQYDGGYAAYVLQRVERDRIANGALNAEAIVQPADKPLPGNTADMAAWTLTARVLLNLDETIVRQ